MRWTVIDNEPSRNFPIYCRGNTGEVYPNVMTPLSGSLVLRAAQRGQESVIIDLGFLSRSHLDDGDGAITGVFGGYLYGNVSMTRVAAARAPGMTVGDIDTQMFGLSDAPPYVPRPDDRSVRCTLRLGRKTAAGLLRPDRAFVERDRWRAAAWIASLPTIDGANDAQLIDVASHLPPKFEEMMAHLVLVSAYAGISRSLLEKLTDGFGDRSLVNHLTVGLGTIESAEPAFALWELGRHVASSAALASEFDRGLDGLHDRLGDVDPGFAAELHRFLTAFGSRGPDEWELASPTWGTDPSIALAAIDRLRNAPDDRDPARARERLAAGRAAAVAKTAARLPRHRRAVFRRALDTTALYAAMREATKATFVRCLEPARRSLHELARRHDLEPSELFLLTFDELDPFVRLPASFSAVFDERRATRDFLQARVPPFWFEGALPDPDTWQRRATRHEVNTDARTLRGMGVCPGIATGAARIVTDPAEPGELQPGDILVAPLTDPAWTPLFLAVAGVVVDVGAQQSHAAIIARELGIPAVVSVTGASSTIADGALITVDGDTGIVTVHASGDVS